MRTEATATRERELRALIRVSHPRQALVIALGVAALAALMGRPPREVAMAGGAVLLAQLALGMINDLFDDEIDARSGVAEKPIAHGQIASGNVGFALLVVLLLLVPFALQNGTLAGGVLLGSVVVGVIHNRWWKSTVLSWVGWAVTFAAYAAFLAYGGWGAGQHVSEPTVAFMSAAAALGVAVHFWTALPDLVVDNAAGVRHLPLRIALRTGAPRLLVATVAFTLGVLVAGSYLALTVGVAH